MAQYTIGISEVGYLAVQEAIARFKERGFMASATRAVQYLVEFEKTSLDLLERAVNAPSEEEGWHILRDGLVKASTTWPSVLPRGTYKPSRRATAYQRAFMYQEIQRRLGWPNPSDAMVNEFLDGDTDAMFRKKVLEQEEFKKSLVAGDEALKKLHEAQRATRADQIADVEAKKVVDGLKHQEQLADRREVYREKSTSSLPNEEPPAQTGTP